MAEVQTSQDVSAEELQLVIFRLASEEYALPITKVQEINRLAPITQMPQTPPFVEGIINLRGRIIPVLDLRKRFQLAVNEHSEDSRIIIVEVGGQTVGVIVDAVAEVIRLGAAQVEPPPPSFMLDAQYIQGIGKVDNRLLILLEIDRIITTEEEIVLKQLGA